MTLEFYDIKHKINLNNLVFVYSTGKNYPKGFWKLSKVIGNI